MTAGDYLGQYIPSSGIRFSFNAGSDALIDSSANCYGFTDILSVTQEQTLEGISIGCYKLSRISDFVSNDANNIQNDREVNVSRVEVILQSADGTELAKRSLARMP